MYGSKVRDKKKKTLKMPKICYQILLFYRCCDTLWKNCTCVKMIYKLLKENLSKQYYQIDFH